MSVQQQHLEQTNLIAPFDYGLSFAMRHAGALLQISVLPALLKIFLRYVEYFRPLTPRDAFLIIVLDMGAKTWLLVTVMLLCIITLQGRRASVFQIGQRALISMPKVIMSCVFLMMIAAAFFLAPWMYIFILFLMWAPIFCATEITAKSFREEDADDEADFEDPGSVVASSLRQRPLRYFADRPIWDLGFARSIHFAANRANFIVTLQLALMFLVALTVPLAFVVSIAGYYHSFGWVVLESFLSFFTFAMVLGTAGAAFLRLLPKSAIEEIGIVDEQWTAQVLDKPLRFHGRIFPFFLLALLGGIATKGTIDYIIVNNTKPPTLVSHLESVNFNPKQVVISLKLEDKKNLFRWLSPLSFQLELIPDLASVPEAAKAAPAPVPSPAAAAAPAAPEKNDASKADAKPEKEPVLLEPQRAMPYAPDGTALPEETFVPYDKPLRLVLYFENPLKPEQSKGRYILHYVPVIGESEAFISGHFGE